MQPSSPALDTLRSGLKCFRHVVMWSFSVHQLQILFENYEFSLCCQNSKCFHVLDSSLLLTLWPAGFNVCQTFLFLFFFSWRKGSWEMCANKQDHLVPESFSDCDFNQYERLLFRNTVDPCLSVVTGWYNTLNQFGRCVIIQLTSVKLSLHT